MRKSLVLVYLFGLLMLTSPVLAQQTSDLDSLIAQVNSASEIDTNQVNDLIEISSLLVRTYTDSARSYALEAAGLARKLNFKRGEAAAYRYVGVSFGIQNDVDNSTSYFERAKEIYEALGDDERLATINASLGVNYARKNQFDLALIYYLEAIDNYEAYGDLERMGVILTNTGNLFLQQNLFDEALEYYERAEEILTEVNNESTLALVYSSLATLKDLVGENEEARDYAELSVEYSLKTRRYTTIIHSYNLLGDYHMQKGEPDSALVNYLESLKYSETIRNETTINSSKCLIASVYIELEDFEEARRYLKEVLEWSETQPIIRQQELRALNLLIELESKAGNFEPAFGYSQTLSERNDSLHAEEMGLKISELETIYETEKKEAQIQLLEVQNEVANLRSLVIGVVAVFIILCIIYGFWQFYRRKAEQKKIKIDSLKQELKQFGMVISEKNHFISKFREDLEKVRFHVHSYEGRKELTSMSDNIHHNMNVSGDEKVLFQKVEQVNTGFFAGLKKLEHELTAREERLATLVQMDLTNKDIANILHMEPDSVKGARRRLKRKLELDANTDLTDYLKRITA